MKCQNLLMGELCGAELIPSAKFCSGCGLKVQNKEENNESLPCPKCTSLVTKRQIFCKVCGWRIYPSIFESKKIVCAGTKDDGTKCGKELLPHMKFCVTCGTVQSKPAATLGSQNKSVQDQQRSSAAQAAIEAAQRINQQLGKGAPKSPSEVNSPLQKPGPHAGLGMVVTEEFKVPDKMVGLTLGSQNKSVQDQQRSSAAQAAIEAAQRINQQLGKGAPKSPSEVNSPLQKPGPHAGLGMVVTEEFKVPDKMVGLTLGSQNKSLQDQQRSSAAQAAIEAAQRINQQLGKGAPKSPSEVNSPLQKPGPHAGLGMVVTEEFKVPDKMVGLIIGKGGEQITRLQAETGCKIQIAPGGPMAESNKIFCEPCEHDGISIAATLWCNDCCEGFCEECIKGHKLTKILRTHHIITIKDHLKTSDLNVSQTCTQHSKPFDSFCPQHDELLCLKCIQLHHSNCGDLLRIDEAVKGVKVSTALTDLHEQITTLLRNIARFLELNIEHKNSFSDQKEAIKSTINDTRARINTKLDQLQEKLLDELETKYDKTVFNLDELKDRLHENEKKVLGLQTQLSGLKAYASDMQTFIGMKIVGTSVYSEKHDFDMNMKNIHSDLQLCINSSTSSLIDDLKEFGEIILQNKCDYATYLEPQNSKAQLDVVQLFDITKARLEKRYTLNPERSEHPLCIQGCVVLNNKYTVFTDSLNKRLIIHDQNGKYKDEIRLPTCPKYITIVDQDDVAVSYQRATSHVDIINLTTNKTTPLSCNSNSWHNVVCFHDGTFFIAVALEGVRELTKDGVLIKTFHSQVRDIGKIDVHDMHFYYSRTGGRTLYCTDLEGNPIWEFSDDRLVRDSYATPFAIDSHGNVYVMCYKCAVVLGISFDGKKHAVLLTELDGLDKPSAIFCDQQNNQLLVCNETDGKAFVFYLKN